VEEQLCFTQAQVELTGYVEKRQMKWLQRKDKGSGGGGGGGGGGRSG
jgi:hypothetical protein